MKTVSLNKVKVDIKIPNGSWENGEKLGVYFFGHTL